MKANSTYLWNSNYLFQFYLSFGIFIPFYQLWLSDIGINNSDIGIILAVGLVSRCLSSIGVGYIIKQEAQYLPILKLLSIFSLVTALLMCFFASSMLSLVVITCLFNIAIAPLFGISESLISILDKRKILDYGTTRLWGSMGFIVATIMGGYVFDTYSESVFPVVLTAICIALVFSSIIGTSALTKHLQGKTKTTAIAFSKPRLYPLHILLFITIIILIQSSHAFYYGFSSLYWEQLSISKTIIGYFWAVSICSEVLVFLLAKRLLTRLSVTNLLILASLSAIIRWLTLAYIHTPAIIFLIQLLHGGTFALTQLAMIKGIQLYITDAKVSNFQGIFQGGYTALIAIFTYVCGVLYDSYFGSLFVGMAILGVISLAFCFYLVKVLKQNPNTLVSN